MSPMSRVCLMGKSVVRRSAGLTASRESASASLPRLWRTADCILIYVVHVPNWSILYVTKYRNENISSIKANSAWKRVCGALQISSSGTAESSSGISFISTCCLGQSAKEMERTKVQQWARRDPEATFQGTLKKKKKIKEKGNDYPALSCYKNQIECRTSQVRILWKEIIKKCNLMWNLYSRRTYWD